MLPLIFDGIRKEIAEAEIFSSFPANTFLENIATDTAGNLFVTSLEQGTVYKIGFNGEKEEYAKVKGKLAGIIHISEQSFLLNGWNEEGILSIYLLENNRVIVHLLSLPDALFLNGMAALDNTLFLICDSYKECIWKFNLKTKKAEVWLQHVLLSRIDEANPMPAANGIKIFENIVFVSNIAKQVLIKISSNDGKAGTQELFMDKLNLDDFAIDNGGTIYATITQVGCKVGRQRFYKN